jgi:hypothetical protein
MENRSTETAIYMLETLEQRSHPLGIFRDLTKAFDCIVMISF